MPLKAPASNKEFEIVPAGNHVARLYRIIHIGTIKGDYMGQEKDVDTIMLGFELPDEKRVFKEGEPEKPFAVSGEYTLSMGPKANLRKLVDGMIGRSLTDEEADDFDILTLIGTPCLLNVIHKTSQAGKQYAKIQAATPLPKSMTAPAPFNDPFILDFDENWSQEKFAAQPEFLRTKIAGSKNYNEKFPSDEGGLKWPEEEINPEDIPF